MTISHRYAVPQEERVPAQVSQVSNTKFIKVVLEKFDAQQKGMFEESSIGHVARLPEIKFSAQLIHEMINRLIVCRKENEAWFNVNQCYCRFGLPEYSLITGLRCSSVPTDEQSKKIIDKTRLWGKYFSASDRVTCTDLEKVFLKCPNRNDRYKLGLALIIEGIFNARDRNVGIHPDTLSIADDLEFFNSYPWGTVCYRALIKSIKRGWSKKADLAKINNVDRMSYTVYGFPLAIQLWVYEAIPEVGTRFASKIGEELPRMLRWSGSRQPQSRTYSEFLDKTRLHVWATLRPSEEEASQPHYMDLVPLGDVEDAVLDSVVRDAIQLQDGQPEEEIVRPTATGSKGKEIQKSGVGRRRRRQQECSEESSESESDASHEKDQPSGSGQDVVHAQLILDEVKIILKNHNDAMEKRFTDFTEEIRARFDRVESRIENHACGIREYAVAETKELHLKIDELGKKMMTRNDPFADIEGQYDLGGSHFEGGHAQDYNQSGEGEVRETSAGGSDKEQHAGDIGVGDDKGEQLPLEENAVQVEAATIATVVDKATNVEEIVASAEATTPGDVPACRPRSSRIRIPSLTTKTPYTRSGRKKVKRDDKRKS